MALRVKALDIKSGKPGLIPRTHRDSSKLFSDLHMCAPARTHTHTHK